MIWVGPKRRLAALLLWCSLWATGCSTYGLLRQPQPGWECRLAVSPILNPQMMENLQDQELDQMTTPTWANLRRLLDGLMVKYGCFTP